MKKGLCCLSVTLFSAHFVIDLTIALCNELGRKDVPFVMKYQAKYHLSINCCDPVMRNAKLNVDGPRVRCVDNIVALRQIQFLRILELH